MKPILSIIMILVAVNAGAGEVDYYKKLPLKQSESYLIVCEKGVSLCTQYGTEELRSILERMKACFQRERACEDIPKLQKDIDAMIERMK